MPQGGALKGKKMQKKCFSGHILSDSNYQVLIFVIFFNLPLQNLVYLKNVKMWRVYYNG